MENKSTTKQRIVYVIMALLIVLGAAISILTVKNGEYFTIPAILNIVIYVVMVIYLLSAYKIPHSNFLKYVLLLYALSVMIFALQSLENSFIFSALMGTNALLVAYMSGRLGKLKTNKIVIWIIIAIFVVDIIIVETNAAFINVISNLDGIFNKFIYIVLPFSKLIQFVTLAYAYVSRYHQHIEAGKRLDEEMKTK